MVDMARKQILPAVEGYAAELADFRGREESRRAQSGLCSYETGLVTKLSAPDRRRSPRRPTSWNPPFWS